jgi:hypothetical protein
MMLTDLADVLRSAGLTVVEEPGWKTRGHGPMVDVRTIICHHTGGTKDLRVIIDGRPGLGGPLAQCWLARDGVWHIVAAGLCWHAGVSRDPSYTNSHAIGIEAEATGVDPWPQVQYDSYVQGAAALMRHYGVPLDHVLGHKETCAPVGRKTDPNFDMDAFRSRATAVTQGDDMPTVQEIVDAVLAAPVQVGNDRWSLGDAVGRAASTARRIELQVKASDNPDEIAAAVAKALPQGVATTEQLTAAFVAALKQLTQEAS